MKVRGWTALLASLTVGTGLAVTTSVTTGLAEPAGAKISIWSGVYTPAQSERGEKLYSGACAQCHGRLLNGAAQPDQPPSPAIARVGFLRKWEGKPLGALFTYVREMMPTDNPGSLTDQQAIDVITHMFAVSKLPTGDKELPPDANGLAGIVIEAEPKK